MSKTKFIVYGAYDRPSVAREKLDTTPCAMKEAGVEYMSREEQCLRAFAAGEVSRDGKVSSFGTITEEVYLHCKDPEQLESALDQCEDMGDCQYQYNKFMLRKFKYDQELEKKRKENIEKQKAQYEEYKEWLRNKNNSSSSPDDSKKA